MCSLSSKRPFWCRFLYRLVRSTQPKRCLELGSCVGISASYIAAAMKENGFGKLTTLEGSPSLADIARQTLAGLGLGNAQVVTGRFSDTLPGVLGHSQFDFVFIDGHHDRDATIQYFEQILPHATGTIVFDDITWSQGMLEAWAVVSRHARVKSASQLRSIGVCEL
jgi:predicted O-methyltransferase YrrM